jgi:hypothetical protein
MDTAVLGNIYSLEEIFGNISRILLPATVMIQQLKVKTVLFIILHSYANVTSSDQEKSTRKTIINKIREINFCTAAELNQISSLAGRFYKCILQPVSFIITPPDLFVVIKQLYISCVDRRINSLETIQEAFEIMEKQKCVSLFDFRDRMSKYTKLLGKYKSFTCTR